MPLAPSRETNGRKIRSRSSSLIPGPLSSIATRTVPFDCSRLSSTRPPSGVQRNAFEEVRDDLQHAVAVGLQDRLRSDLAAVLDRASPRFLAERRVRALAERLHVDLFLEQREAVRVELRQIEDVADEPREAFRLGCDHVERLVAQLRVLDHTLAERLDVAANRGQRRAQLVRHRHQEVALARLRLGESLRHLAEALGEMTDLVAPRNVADVDRVATARDVVGSIREAPQRAGDPPREVPAETARDDEPTREREREALDEGDPAVLDVGARLGDDERAEADPVLLDGPRDGG